MRRIFLVATALVLLSAAPAAAQYGPGASISVHPGHVMPLRPFTVTGDGFVPGESVTLTLGGVCGIGSGGGAAVGTAVVGPSGSFSAAVGGFPIDTAPGTYGVFATGASGDSACSNVIVRLRHPVIDAGHHVVVPGHPFMVTGINFVPGETVTLTFGRLCGTGGSAGDAVIGTAVVGPDGRFSVAAHAIPAGTKPNTYGIRATGAHGSFTCTDVFVTGNPLPHPTMRLQPSTIEPSAHPVVTGQGFVPGETARITFGRACGSGSAGTDVFIGSVAVAADGTFSTAAAQIPARTPTGTYGIRVTGASGDLSCANVFVRRHLQDESSALQTLKVNKTTGIGAALVASGGMVLLRTRRRGSRAKA